MAVTVTDNRAIFNKADSLTGWTTVGAGTDAVTYCENISLGDAYNIAEGESYFTAATSSDYSDTLMYGYSSNNALQESWNARGVAGPPHCFLIGDGTNLVAFAGAGGDRDIFKHNDGPVSFQCHLLDGAYASIVDSAGETWEHTGTFASLNLAAVTQMGFYWETLSKALGGGSNVWADIMRVGNDGIQIHAGTTGDRGTFTEVVAEDKAITSNKAHGIIREYTPGNFGLQGPLNFGTTGGTTWFDDSNFLLTFEDRRVAHDKYYLRVTGSVSNETHVIWDAFTITTARPSASCDFSDINITELSITNGSFSGLGNPITFAQTGSHIVNNNTFNNVGQIDTGLVQFQGDSIIGTTNISGSILMSASGSEAILDLSLTSGGSGHGIYITETGSYTFNNFTYTGFGADATTDAVLFNDSGGEVTASIVGGDSPTIKNGAGSSTKLVNNVEVTFTTLVNDSEVRVYLSGSGNPETEIAGVENSTGGEFAWSATGGIIVNYHIHHLDYEFIRVSPFTVPAANAEIPIQQREDRNTNYSP